MCSELWRSEDAVDPGIKANPWESGQDTLEVGLSRLARTEKTNGSFRRTVIYQFTVKNLVVFFLIYEASLRDLAAGGHGLLKFVQVRAFR